MFNVIRFVQRHGKKYIQEQVIPSATPKQLQDVVLMIASLVAGNNVWWEVTREEHRACVHAQLSKGTAGGAKAQYCTAGGDVDGVNIAKVVTEDDDNMVTCSPQVRTAKVMEMYDAWPGVCVCVRVFLSLCVCARRVYQVAQHCDERETCT